MNTAFSAALVAAMASAAPSPSKLSEVSTKKQNDFSKMVIESQFNGKPLYSTLPESETILLKRKVVYPEYDWDNEYYLNAGCYINGGTWYAYKWDCESIQHKVEYCIAGHFYVNELNSSQWECDQSVSKREYRCAKYGEKCDGGVIGAIDRITEILEENAAENGLSAEVVEDWVANIQIDWENFEASQQEQADELANEHAEEAIDMVAPVIDGVIDDLTEVVVSGLDDLQDKIQPNVGDDEVVLAAKKMNKSHNKQTGAYVAGGVTLLAAAVGAAYLLKKRQDMKGLREALLSDSFVRAETV